IRLFCIRHGVAAPGKISRVSAAITGITAAGILPALTADFERREAGLRARVACRNLIDGDARADVGAGGLAGLAAGEEGRLAAGVIAGTVAVGAGLVASEPGEDTHFRLEWCER